MLWCIPAIQVAMLYRVYVQNYTTNRTSTWGDIEYIEKSLGALRNGIQR